MQEKRVGDLVSEVKDLDWIKSGSLVGEAAGLLGRQSDRGGPGLLLVARQNKNNREILGMVTLDDILSKVEPPALAEESDLPIFWQGQFAEQVRELFKRQVDAVMVEPEYALNRNSTLMEALHLMNSRGARILVVVDGDLVVGLITRRRLHGEIINLAQA